MNNQPPMSILPPWNEKPLDNEIETLSGDGLALIRLLAWNEKPLDNEIETVWSPYP